MTREEAYKEAREDGARYGLEMMLSWVCGFKADALMGYAHGLEDAAQELKGRANRVRYEQEEADFARLMAY